MKTRARPVGFVAVFTAIIGFGAALCVPLRVAKADDAAADAAAARERAVGRATERGLAWLAGRYENGLPPESETPVAVVSLSGLAFLEAGATPDQGRYGKALRRCIDGVADRADANTGLIADKANPAGAMYGHGYATLFLAEAFAKTHDDMLKDRLSGAVRLIAKAQNRDGGWRYRPQPMDADVSVTACQLMALTAAKRVGINVPGEVIERGIAFVRSCQDRDDGGFHYMPAAGNSGLPRSAAATAVLQRAPADGAKGNGRGAATDRDLDRALKYLTQTLARNNPAAEGHFYYAAYYSAIATWAQGGEVRSKGFAAVRDQLLDRQREDGAWEGDHSREYATASALVALQVPDSHLATFRPVAADKPGGRDSDGGGGGGGAKE